MTTHAQVSSNFWSFVSGILRPNVVGGTTFRIPWLGSTGNPCLTIANTSGDFATTTCGGFSSSTAASVGSLGAVQLASSTPGFFHSVANFIYDTINNRLGIGTTTPTQTLTVVGNQRLTGAFFDSSNASGTAGMVLRSTGTGTQWVGTSTLGLGSRWEDAGDFLRPADDDKEILLYDVPYSLTINGNSENPFAIDLAGADGGYEYGIGRAADTRTWSGREAFSFHCNTSRSQSWFGSGWTKLMELLCDTGDLSIAGNFTLKGANPVISGDNELTVSSPGTVNVQSGSDAFLTLTNAGVILASNSGPIQIGTTSADPLILTTNSTERLAILDTGAWEVEGSSGTLGYVLQSQGPGSSPQWVATSSLGITGGSGSGNSAWTIGNAVIYNATSTDNVGVGTTTPNKLFHVYGSQTGGIMKLERVLANTTGFIGTQQIKAKSTGDMTIGFGPTQTFLVEDNANVENTVGDFGCFRGTADNNGFCQLRPYIGGVATWPGFLIEGTSASMVIGSSTTFGTLGVQGTTSNPTAPTFRTASSSGAFTFTVNADGRVGVGTTSPIASFSVVGTSTADCFATNANPNSCMGRILAIPIGSAQLATLNDATAYYWGGNYVVAPSAAAGNFRFYPPTTGTIIGAVVTGQCNIAGDNTAWPMKIRLNDTTDYTIATTSLSQTVRPWQSMSLNIPITSLSDFMEMKTDNPTWTTTNPAQCKWSGALYLLAN